MLVLLALVLVLLLPLACLIPRIKTLPRRRADDQYSVVGLRNCGGKKPTKKKTWVWKRVLVSATGECTPVNEDGDSIGGDEDLQDESVVGAAEVTRQRRRQERKLSLPRMSFGKLTESFEDKVVDAFLWLLKQTQGKQIHATKVPTYSRISSFTMPPDS